MFEKIMEEIRFLWDRLRGRRIIRLKRSVKKRDDDFFGGAFKLVRVLANRNKRGK